MQRDLPGWIISCTAKSFWNFESFILIPLTQCINSHLFSLCISFPTLISRVELPNLRIPAKVITTQTHFFDPSKLSE